ncbi:MAG TPA: dihydrofolate reductase [Methylovirgula sp.]|nr:dihydrofolate reductase [Methylovirgula sp.]
MKPLAAVVAIAENGVIGRDNRLPWHISSDLKHFKALTLGKPVIMGRKTFASLGRVLPGRETIVVTRDRAFSPPAGVFVVTDPQAALELGQRRAEALGAAEIILAGGAEIFRALLDRVDRLYVTYVALSPPGDAFFPPLDWSKWEEIRREPHAPGKGDDAAFVFADYVRRHA